MLKVITKTPVILIPPDLATVDLDSPNLSKPVHVSVVYMPHGA
jgi:hypothetical protein